VIIPRQFRASSAQVSASQRKSAQVSAKLFLFNIYKVRVTPDSAPKNGEWGMGNGE